MGWTLPVNGGKVVGDEVGVGLREMAAAEETIIGAEGTGMRCG